MPPDGAESDVPSADAVALLAVDAEPSASTTSAPPPRFRPRSTVAATESVANVSARAAPTAADVPLAVPVAVVESVACWTALTVRSHGAPHGASGAAGATVADVS